MGVGMRVIKSADRIGGDAEPPKGKFHGHAMQSLLHHTTEETRASFVLSLIHISEPTRPY